MGVVDDDGLESLAAVEETPHGLRDWRGVSFIEACQRWRVGLTPGQLAIALVVFDGFEPKDLPPRLRELARQFFGPVDTIPAIARAVIVLVIGARAGKSYVFSALRAVHAAVSLPLWSNEHGREGLAANERPFSTIVAPEVEQREQCFSYVLGVIQNDPDLTAMAVAAGAKLGSDGKLDISAFSNAESIDLKRADDFVVCIRAIPAKRGGGALRGSWTLFAALEECAFFRDANHVVNDRDLFTAVSMRIWPGGQVMLSSTPWLESGVLYEEFTANHPAPWVAAPHLRQAGHPHRAVAAHAPTIAMFPARKPLVDLEYQRDEWNAKREFGAQFLGLGAVAFFDAVAIAECIDPTLTNGSPPSGNPQSITVQGNDLGFTNDAAGGAVVERTPDFYSLLAWREVFAALENLKPSEVLNSLAELALSYRATELVGDGHYVEAAKEAFWGRGLIWITSPAGSTGKAEMFQAARLIIEERKARIPNDPRLLKQLREVRKRPLPGGGIAIEQPRTKTTQTGGGHGDVCSAFVAALWRLSKLTLPEAPRLDPEDPRLLQALEWERKIEAKRLADERKAAFERRTGLAFDDY